MIEEIISFLQSISPILLFVAVILAIVGVVIAIERLLLYCRDRRQDKRRLFDDNVKNFMDTLVASLVKLHEVKENTGFAPDKIDINTVGKIRSLRDVASALHWSSITTLRDEHPSKALSRLLDTTHKAHSHMVLQKIIGSMDPNPKIPESTKQELATAAKAAYYAYKDLYRALFRERKTVHPNLKPPDSPFLRNILKEKNS